MDLEESMRRVTQAFKEAENADLDTVSKEYFNELDNHINVFREMWQQCLHPMFMEWKRCFYRLTYSSRGQKRLLFYAVLILLMFWVLLDLKNHPEKKLRSTNGFKNRFEHRFYQPDKEFVFKKLEVVDYVDKNKSDDIGAVLTDLKKQIDQLNKRMSDLENINQKYKIELDTKDKIIQKYVAKSEGLKRRINKNNKLDQT